MIKIYLVTNEAQYTSIVGVKPPDKEFKPSVIITGMKCYDTSIGTYRHASLILPGSDDAPLTLSVEDDSFNFHVDESTPIICEDEKK